MFDRFYMQILDMSKTASIVILIVLAVRLLMKKAPKVFSYALWAIVLFRLLCPVAFETQVSIVPELPATSNGYTLADESISILGAGEAAYQAVGDVLNGGLGIQHVRTTEKEADGMTRYVTTDWWSVWILFGKYVWVVGIAAMLAYSFISYYKIRKLLEIVVPLRDNIYIADDIKSPFVIGFLKPKIYLPCNLGETEQEYIILHEQHHIRRFDHIFKALAFLALTIHWFNPLVWLAFVLAGKDMEMSCDEAVMFKAGEDVRADYSASLLTLATGRRIIAGTPLAFGEGDPKGRIKNLGKWKKPTIWVIIIAIILCVVLAVCLLTNQARSQETVGSAWYYGSVTAQDDDSSSPFIHVLCNDGNVRVFDYEAGNVDIPNDMVGKQIRLRARVHNVTGDLIMTRAEIVEDIFYDDLDTAIQNVILEYHRHSSDPGTLTCANFYTLASETSGPAGSNEIHTVTEYGIVYHHDFTYENGVLLDGSGCNVPTVLTFRVNEDGTYTLAEYWEPRDGNLYPEDIKAKFPPFVWPDTVEHLAEQQIAVYQQVMEGFQLGTDVVIEYLIADICNRAQWADGFAQLMQMSERQREILAYYGTDTLAYCLELFDSGGQDDLKGQVMAYVCSEILDSMGVDPIKDWSWQKSGQDWFNAVTEDFKDSSDILGKVYPQFNWGITLTAENASPNGATITLSQEGGYLPNRLIYGADFNIQKYENNQWVDVEPLQELFWTTVAYSVPLNDSVTWNVDWSNTFGTLEPGLYRFCKGITDHRAPGDNDYATLYAEFEIS